MYDQASKELIRHVRGTHSQRAMAIGLGFKSNPIADWENGRRSPTAGVFFACCAWSGIDVLGALERFDPSNIPVAYDDASLAEWIDRLRGSTPIGTLAKKLSVSRFSVGRWLSGESRLRLKQFLALVDAITGRVSELAAELVDIEQIPSLLESHRARQRSKEVAWRYPWSEAILRLVETEAYQQCAHDDGRVAKWLGISEQEVAAVIAELRRCDIIEYDGMRWNGAGPLTVSTRTDPATIARHKADWVTRVAERLREDVRDDELSAYNVFSCTKDTYLQTRDILHNAYREIRALLVSSDAEGDDRETEVAAITMQCLRFIPPEHIESD